MSDEITRLQEQTCLALIPEYYGHIVQAKKICTYCLEVGSIDAVANYKIACIKAYREVFGTGLGDTNAILEWMISHGITVIVDLDHSDIVFDTLAEAEAKALLWNNKLGSGCDGCYVTAKVFTQTDVPESTDGIVEATRIAQANDAVIEPFINGIMRLYRNAYLQTSDTDIIAQFETEFGITPATSATIESRRQAVIDYLNRDLTINDDVLLSLVRAAAGNNEVNTRINAQSIVLDVYADDDSSVTCEQLLAALRTAMERAPANLVKNAIFDATLSKTLTHYHATLFKERCDLGSVPKLETHQTVIYWGDTVQIPDNARLATPVKSRCWWIFGGQTWSSNNNHGKGTNYTPVYADGTESGELPADIYSAYSSGLVAIGEGKLIRSGLCANTYTGTNTALQTARLSIYNYAIEVYSTPAIAQTVNTTLSIFEFDIPDYDYPLPYKPNEIYSIQGNTITWNDTGYLSDYFAGKPLQLEYYLVEQFTHIELASQSFETIS